MTEQRRSFPVDSVSILFLSLLRREHSNLFRFSMELKEPVCPETLQLAVDRIWQRCPTVAAAVQQGFFHYRVVHTQLPPRVTPDPGLLLTMSRQEMETCALRVYYEGCTFSMEFFHVLTDGFGAITTLVTLVSEYLAIRSGVAVPPGELRLDMSKEPDPREMEDSFLPLAGAKPWHLPSRYSYLPPRPADTDWQIRLASMTVPTAPLLDTAHRYGVTLNTLLTAAMASAIMEQQLRHGSRRLKPVRIMVPVNLRRMFGSCSLRNFALYGLPTMEPEDRELPMDSLCRSFDAQIKAHYTKEKMAAMSSYNVRMQNGRFFRILPWKLKAAAMKLGYRFFGESNSSLTLTNLGRAALPEELLPHVAGMQVYMTPRQGSPYGCTILSFGDTLTVNISKFTQDKELETLFFEKLRFLSE